MVPKEHNRIKKGKMGQGKPTPEFVPFFGLKYD